jgi:hypothetical protein
VLAVVVDSHDVAVPQTICDAVFPGQPSGAGVISVLLVEHLQRDPWLRLARAEGEVDRCLAAATQKPFDDVARDRLPGLHHASNPRFAGR